MQFLRIPPPRMVQFLKKHHVLTLSTALEGKPWCAHCFYVFFEDEMMLAFTSDRRTRHISEAIDSGGRVAASVVLETRVVGKIQGVQMEGLLRAPSQVWGRKIRYAYLSRFPEALVMNTCFWRFDVFMAKMTDNMLGFSNKAYWIREDAV